MPHRVLLLRHAESADPTVFHGAESDIELSDRGRRQAEAIAPLLAALRPTAIVSSAMRRARLTAEPTARHCGLPLRTEPLLHERRVGALSGTAVASPEGLWPQTLERWIRGDTSFAPEGAESFDAIRDRVLPVWERITEGDGGPLVVVAHGLVVKVLLLTLLPGWSVADWKRLGPIPNVGINELERTAAGWNPLRLNEIPATVASV